MLGFMEAERGRWMGKGVMMVNEVFREYVGVEGKVREKWVFSYRHRYQLGLEHYQPYLYMFLFKYISLLGDNSYMKS